LSCWLASVVVSCSPVLEFDDNPEAIANGPAFRQAHDFAKQIRFRRFDNRIGVRAYLAPTRKKRDCTVLERAITHQRSMRAIRAGEMDGANLGFLLA